MFTLWLPILASAVAVFILSSIIHMALPFWHRSDYRSLPDEAAVLEALRPLNIPPGEYMAPRPASNEDMRSESFKEKMNRGPIFQINLMKPGPISLGRPLALWFVYLLVVAFVVAHVTTVAVGSATDTRVIFHTVALTSLMGYVMALWQGVIWFQRPVLTAFKATIDGVIYAIVTGMIFVYFWPR